MPYVGLTSLHFVQWRKTTWRKDQCVNALCRAHVSARPVFAAENVVFEEGVNALCRALVSALGEPYEKEIVILSVSMPYVGLSSLHPAL